MTNNLQADIDQSVAQFKANIEKHGQLRLLEEIRREERY